MSDVLACVSIHCAYRKQHSNPEFFKKTVIIKLQTCVDIANEYLLAYKIGSDYLRSTPPSMYQIFVENNQIFFDIPRQDGTTSLKDCYLQFEFNVTHRAAVHAQYADRIPTGLVKLGPVASLIKNRSITINGKEKTDLNDAHIKCSMYIRKTSRKGSDLLSMGFHKIITTRERETTNNKTTKRKCLLKIFDEVVFFGSGEHQENAIYGLG